jgi:mono/diheme cytochrome c family protein
MMRSWGRARIAGGLMLCYLGAAVAQTPQPQQSTGAAAKPAQAVKQPANTAMETAGEQKFQQNCSRCHNAPQELSPRITGTVVMHMRVRASLSEADAKAILHYLAP